jgi:hypothetical protein
VSALNWNVGGRQTGVAVLTRLRDQGAAVRQILLRIAQLPGAEQGKTLSQLLILAGLRKLTHTAHTIREEARKMPILNSILEHEVIGPAILQGRREGIHEGIQRGALGVVRRLLESRFGPLTEVVERRLGALTEAELADLSVRVLEANGIEELFSR